MEKELEDLIKEAKNKYENMSPEEKEEMLRQQRKSWVMGEMAMNESVSNVTIQRTIEKSKTPKVFDRLKLYDQTVFTDPDNDIWGDCFRAATKTLLQYDGDLPHPIQEEEEFITKLYDLGVLIKSERWSKYADFSHLPRVVIAGGYCQRDGLLGYYRHAVIWDRYSCRMLFDPHPSRAGIFNLLELTWFEEVTDESLYDILEKIRLKNRKVDKVWRTEIHIAMPSEKDEE